MANVKISDLTSAASVTGTQQFEVNDSGTSKKVTGAQILSYVEGEISSSPTLTGQVSFDDGTAAAPSITNTGDSNTGIYFSNPDEIAFTTGGTNRVSINASGNVVASGNIELVNLLPSGNIELGHATDTTISRAAAGVISVEGNRVPSPASQAQGDILYRGATDWERLPAGTSGQFLKTNGSGANPSWINNITVGTAVALTGLSSTDFTSLPSTVKRITLVFNRVSLNGAGDIQVQLGTTSSIETTGYISSSSRIGASSVSTGGSTAAFFMNLGGTTELFTGTMTIHNISGNIWVCAYVGNYIELQTSMLGAGTKELASLLTRIRVKTSTGTFDNGSVNIMYE